MTEIAKIGYTKQTHSGMVGFPVLEVANVVSFGGGTGGGIEPEWDCVNKGSKEIQGDAADEVGWFKPGALPVTVPGRLPVLALWERPIVPLTGCDTCLFNDTWKRRGRTP